MTNTPGKSEMLLPCPTPFCAVPEPFIERVGARLFRVKCKYCRVETEVQFNEAAAIEQWNTRSRPPADQVPDMVERVARAICDSRYPDDPRWPILPESVREQWRDYARAAIAALQSVPAASGVGWRPIETFDEPTSPGSGDGVLVADRNGTVGEAYFRNFGDRDDGWWWANTNWGDYPEPDRPDNPTHWRPLPEPPALKASGEE